MKVQMATVDDLTLEEVVADTVEIEGNPTGKNLLILVDHAFLDKSEVESYMATRFKKVKNVGGFTIGFGTISDRGYGAVLVVGNGAKTFLEDAVENWLDDHGELDSVSDIFNLL